MKYDRAFADYFSKVNSFSSGDARRFLEKHGASEAYIRLFLHNQAAKKRVFRITRGSYTLAGNEAVIGFAFRPFYYGMEYAMTLRRIWTQVSNPVIITSTNAVPGIRVAMGRRIVIRRMSGQGFFGYKYMDYSGIQVPVSETEKILVDFIYYRIGIGNEYFSKLAELSDKKKLALYAKRSGRRTAAGVERVLCSLS